MKSIVRSMGAAVTGLFSRELRLPSFDRLMAFISILGLAGLGFILGAAVMHYRLPTSTYIEKAFLGAEAWSRQKTDPSQTAPAAPAQSSILIDKPDKTDDGFTLYTTSSGPWAALIDMRGQTVHRWQMPFSQAFSEWQKENPLIDKQVSWFGCHLFPNGDLLAVYHVDSQIPLGSAADNHDKVLNAHSLTGYGLIKLDKDSQLLWAYADHVHHAFDVAQDGTIYALTQEQSSRTPANMAFVRVPHLADSLVILSAQGKQLDSIRIMEALRDSPYASNQRLMICQNSAPEADYTHANSVMVLPKALAGRFPMFQEGQVLISLRNMNTLAVLDVSKRSVAWAAQGVWRRQHAAQFLDNGHLLLFDNEGDNGPARVLEYNPANQALPWTYTSEDSRPFWASARGDTQRLPNGNTLIVNPGKCRMFEVSPAREVVWEAECLEFTGQAQEEKPFPFTPSINLARRYRAEGLTFLQGGPRARP